MPSRPRAWIAAGIAVALLAATAGMLGVSLPAAEVAAAGAFMALDKIDPADRASLLIDALDGEAAYLVILDEQADLRAASGLRDKAAKGRFVFEALREAADRTQPELIHLLRSTGARVQPFIIVNAVAVRGNLQSLIASAAYPHTAFIVSDTPARAELPPISNLQSPISPSTLEWGVSAVNAPAVWSMGYTGAGIVVGGQDTGVRWDHAALIGHYRGWNGSSANHNDNWHDAIHSDVSGNGSNFACGFDAAAPCDDNGHGTHTVGTVIGDDGAGNQIGVAPGAEWIACRNMDEGWGAPSTYLECFEWFLAPYPIGSTIADGDPAKAPHIITNSWSCPSVEGCLTGQEIISGVLSMRAAGILTVVAATNAGPACSTIVDPPAIYAEAFSVGAFDSGGGIASFSSRGPVTRDGSQRVKPDIAAPGVSVRSAYGAGYAYLSGTSMATPHLAGVAALLWNAAPYLSGDPDLSEWVLRLSATPVFTSQGCGGDSPSARPNNVWGWGKVDAQAAVSATLTLAPTASLTYTLIASGTIVLDASASTDAETPAVDLLARWDFGGDGVWDTAWGFTKTLTGSATLMFPAAAVQIADWGGRSSFAVVVDPSLNLRYFVPIFIQQEP